MKAGRQSVSVGLLQSVLLVCLSLATSPSLSLSAPPQGTGRRQNTVIHIKQGQGAFQQRGELSAYQIATQNINNATATGEDRMGV